MISVQELVSVVLTPFVLWFSLPDCAPAIIDFFREFSVHVDGRGYVCSFAEFNFERHGNVKFGAPNAAQNQRMMSNEGKMEKSFLNFKAANPEWQPSDPSGSAYLNRISEISANYPNAYLRRRHTPTSLGDIGSHVPSRQERADEYDHALRQSKLAAAVRRRGPGASVMGMSTLLNPTSGHAGGVAASVYGDLGMTPSATLGDSQGSAKMAASRTDTEIADDEPPIEWGAQSGLGGSYVTGADGGGEARDEGEEQPEGGVLTLLAQIYGRRDGPAVVI